MRVEKQKMTENNNRLQALISHQSNTPSAGTASLKSWAIAGNSPQPSEGLEMESQRRQQEADAMRLELKQAYDDVQRLRDDRNAYKFYYREEEEELHHAMNANAEHPEQAASGATPLQPSAGSSSSGPIGEPSRK